MRCAMPIRDELLRLRDRRVSRSVSVWGRLREELDSSCGPGRVLVAGRGMSRGKRGPVGLKFTGPKNPEDTKGGRCGRLVPVVESARAPV